MKVGDRLYCYCNHMVEQSEDYDISLIFVVGNRYDIINIEYDRLTVLDKNNNRAWFYRIIVNTNISNIWLYSNWFYSESDYRKLKLEKLKSCGHV